MPSSGLNRHGKSGEPGEHPSATELVVLPLIECTPSLSSLLRLRQLHCSSFGGVTHGLRKRVVGAQHPLTVGESPLEQRDGFVRLSGVQVGAR